MKKIVITVCVVLFTFSISAQEKSSLDLSVGADFVSSYVWRGALQTGISVQPGLGLEIGGFSVSAWGSMDLFEAAFKEIDFSVGYRIAGFSFALTDYWWAGENVYKYFNYKNSTTDHLWEGSVGYTLPVETVPLSLQWNTFFAGADIFKAGNGKRAYSTYIEASYPFSVKEIALEAAIGLTPGESIYASKASVVNLSLKATKEIKISEQFSLPVYGQLIANPRSEGIFFVFGISL